MREAKLWWAASDQRLNNKVGVVEAAHGGERLAGAAALLLGERLQLGPELYGSTTLGSRVPLSGGGAMVSVKASTGPTPGIEVSSS